MTVIAFDGETLAADSRLVDGNVITDVEKIWKLPGGAVYGGCGTGNISELVRDWFQAGCPAEGRVEISAALALDGEDEFGGLLVEADGSCFILDRFLSLSRVRSIPVAIGSGAQGTLALMREGRTAAEAVTAMIKHQIDPHVGGALQTLRVKPAKKVTELPCRPPRA